VSDEDPFSEQLRRLAAEFAAEFAEDEAFELDEETVSRLLRGDVTPGCADLAGVLAAAAGPARPAELTGEGKVLAALRATINETAPRKGRRLRLPLAAAATAGAVLAGGVAAAGVLPAPAQKVAHSLLGGLGVQAPGPKGAEPNRHPPADAPPSAASPTSSVPGYVRSSAPGPATSATPAGKADPSPSPNLDVAALCGKWEEHSQGRGPSLDARESLLLTAAAGRADRIDVMGDGSPSAQPPGSGEHGTRPPAPEKPKKTTGETTSQPAPGPPADRSGKSPERETTHHLPSG